MSSARDVASASPALSEPLPFRLDSILDEQESARAAATLEPDKLDLAFDPERSARGHTSQPEPAADIQDISGRGPGDETTTTPESGPEIVTRNPRSLSSAITSQFSVAQRATAKIPLHNLEARAELRPMSRAALVVSLPAVALVAIGILGYYIYSHSLPLSEPPGAQGVSPAPADVNANGPPTQPIPKIGVSGSSAPSAALGTGSGAATGTEKTAPPAEASTAIPISGVSQGVAAPTDSVGAASQTSSPNDPHRRASTSDQASLGQQSAAKAEGAIKRPGATTSDAGDLRDKKTTLAGGNELSAKRSAANPPTRRYPAAATTGFVQSPPNGGSSSARHDVPRSGTCTEAVAALGLCSRNSGEENK